MKGIFTHRQLVEGGILQSIVNGLVQVINTRYQWQVVVPCLLVQGQDSIQLTSGFHLINIITYFMGPERFKELVAEAAAFRE